MTSKGMRQRTWHWWGGRTEVDYVCERCETIVLVPEEGCQHCRRAAQKVVERITKLKEYVALHHLEGCQ